MIEQYPLLSVTVVIVVYAVISIYIAKKVAEGRNRVVREQLQTHIEIEHPQLIDDSRESR